MNPNKALWEKGDFTQIAAAMRDSGEELVDGLGITSGLGCWTLVWRRNHRAAGGAARCRGAWRRHRRQLVRRQPRARAEGLADCSFQEGDASTSRLSDNSSTSSSPVFGAMFAPHRPTSPRRSCA